MFERRKLRIILFPVLLVVLVLAVGVLFRNEQKTCMGIRILTQEESAQYTEYEYHNFWDYLFFNGEKAALDSDTSTLYICQNIEKDTKSWQLDGDLTISLNNHRLYFLWDEAFEDMAAAVAQGHPFQLVVTDGSQTHMQYNVVFTTLPVLRLEGDFSHMNENDREVASGQMCLWNPYDPELGRYSVKTSELQWHMRGGSSILQDKKSWKLSAKTKTGENRNISLLGLGEDDDWILNSMSLDDTKLKEKLVMDLWNDLAADTAWNLPMSSGEYVEVVNNGRYDGVYLLQRRVDRKYLKLGSEDVLFKGMPIWEAASLEEGYEIIYTPFSAQESYALLEAYVSAVNTDNFIDVSLLIQAGTLTDNTGYKNMFYLLRKTDDGYTMYLIPWDTDLAFGTTWTDRFVYDYDLNLKTPLHRQEYAALSENDPQLEQKLAQRWRQLRQGILSLETVLAKLEELNEKLTASGALAREHQVWGLMYEGEDTAASLEEYARDRFAWLDTYYAQ